MSRHLFPNELHPELIRVASLWGASRIETQPGALLRADWTARLSSLSVTLELQIDAASKSDARCLKPVVTVGCSGGLPQDAGIALLVAEDMVTTLRAARSAWVMVQDVRVWLGSKPCSSCSGRGVSCVGSVCVPCSGAGTISEPETTKE